MRCDPDSCPHCIYIGEGDSLCDVLQEIILEDWTPTEHFMGAGCPYRRQMEKRRRRRRKRGAGRK